MLFHNRFIELFFVRREHLFANILNNPHHVLHKFLPNKTIIAIISDLVVTHYSLSVTNCQDCNNFLNRVLFKDIY